MVRRCVPFYDWWLSWQWLDSFWITLYCHIDTSYWPAWQLAEPNAYSPRTPIQVPIHSEALKLPWVPYARVMTYCHQATTIYLNQCWPPFILNDTILCHVLTCVQSLIQVIFLFYNGLTWHQSVTSMAVCCCWVWHLAEGVCLSVQCHSLCLDSVESTLNMTTLTYEW